MHQPLSREDVRAVDRRAIEEYGMPGVALMENAGRNTAEWLWESELVDRPLRENVIVCAGKGNNGGDGFVIARHLENRGVAVRVLLFASLDDIQGDAAINLKILQHAGTPLAVWGGDVDEGKLREQLSSATWIVDALLGNGVQGEIREPFGTVIRSINEAKASVLAVDLPSGLDCDTGEPLGECIRANRTATFVAPKLGFSQPSAKPFLGEVRVIDIGAPKAALPN
ncbi:NAD(P)H-hydrate epimerase [Thalassoroseus pseudoceratinae]|uniref:NAD(P)H-hydrate epimerase n=1 Tax=Thalassoroseus pseudoceratinae TaxID=2713176 RepID=UPI00141D7687|nr:NAD(P)H-hydrate epimerase [Thalassoroseus pseudoceratinae]